MRDGFRLNSVEMLISFKRFLLLFYLFLHFFFEGMEGAVREHRELPEEGNHVYLRGAFCTL